MTKRVVLIGHPVAHSLSGAMQQAAFDELGVDARYELWDKPPIDLADAVAELRTDDFLGANVFRSCSIHGNASDNRQSSLSPLR